MSSFRIIPRAKVYLIERTNPEGDKAIIERHHSENTALMSLNKLRQKFDPEFRVFTSLSQRDG